MMHIVEIETLDQAKSLWAETQKSPYVIFKHSPRCPISVVAWERFRRQSAVLPQESIVYLVNVLTNRESSQFFAAQFNVEHESPQVLVVKDNLCVFSTSHNAIDANEVANQF